MFCIFLLLCILIETLSTSIEGLKFLTKKAEEEGIIYHPIGFLYQQLESKKPEGKQVEPTSFVSLHFIVKNIEGETLYDSRAVGTPKRMYVQEALKGWAATLPLMKEGDVFELHLPAELGYGEKFAGPLNVIPPGSALTFEIEVLKVKDKKEIKDHIESIIRSPYEVLVGGSILVTIVQWIMSYTEDDAVPLKKAMKKENPRVYFVMERDGEVIGRIVIQLFQEIVPKTTENFLRLCVNPKEHTLSYVGSKIHRIVPGFVCQGGDIVHHDGSGGESVFGPTFADEWTRGFVRHSKRGILSMVNYGSNTNNSQFFITFGKQRHLDGKNVVFGIVDEGFDVLNEIEKCGTREGDPSVEIFVKQSGREME